MRCPTLSELPPPPPGVTGWPWTEESRHLPDRAGEASSWPRITVITPSFNQGQFIEETLRSVLLQGYPDIEYFVLDGGSTDNTVEIIKKYSAWIGFWVSAPDGGQSAAINRGLKMGSGLHATWINSDDLLCKDAFVDHVSSRGLTADEVYIGDCVYIEEHGKPLFTHRGWVVSFEDLVRVRSVWRSGGGIDQPAVLFPLQLALRVGGLNEANHYTMDYEFWGQLLLAGASFHYTTIPFGFFRCHKAQKTQDSLKQTGSMLDAAAALVPLADALSPEVKREILADLEAYRAEYPVQVWKESGRLARMGIPSSIVTPIRNLKNTVGRTLGNLMKLTENSK